MAKSFVFLLLVGLLLLGMNFLFPEIFIYNTIVLIKNFHDKWLALYELNPFKVITLFMCFNLIMALLPVPGISMISFLGGSIFGFLPGVFYSSIATAVGNLFGFLFARYFFRDVVMSKYGTKVRIFEKDWQGRGAMALFSFRLFPLIPSFVANLVMGVSPLKWWTFFWVSWIGRIPMVIAYTYAGVKVASIEQVSDALHPSMIGFFLLLAALPWILKSLYFKVKKL